MRSYGMHLMAGLLWVASNFTGSNRLWDSILFLNTLPAKRQVEAKVLTGLCETGAGSQECITIIYRVEDDSTQEDGSK